MSRPRPRGAGWAVAGMLVLVASLASSSTAAIPGVSSAARDLVASAHPSEAHPVLRDRAVSMGWFSGRQADAVATASATCPDCRGHARGVQIVLRGRPGDLEANNVATAWASCRGCRGSALSVQVVLVRHPDTLVANNRALALTSRCSRCHVWAEAYQVVLATDVRTAMRGLRRDVIAWTRGIAQDRSIAPRGRALGRPGGGDRSDARLQLRALRRLVAERTPGRVVDSSVQVSAR